MSTTPELNTPTVFTVTSPDGLPVEHQVDHYATMPDALLARDRFISRFQHQGYYFTSSMERISLEEARLRCEIGEHPATDFNSEDTHEN
jgi:hypothetical protein